MKTYALLGFLLIVAGLMAFAYQGIAYTTGEKIIDPDPMRMTEAGAGTLPAPSIFGAIAFAGGIVLLVAGGKKGPKNESTRQYRRWLQ
jgi:hypothetical protein